MGISYSNLQKYKKAIECFEQCLEIEEHYFGKGCKESAYFLQQIGVSYLKIS